MSVTTLRVPAGLAETIDHCVAMIDAAAIREASPLVAAADPLPSLLDQCERLTDQMPAEPEPIRTIHHFACTGGTLIAKCLACMPNTQLLSEVEPFSHVQESAGGSRFHPTDLIRLARNSSRGVDRAFEAELFKAGLEIMYQDCRRKGLRLILRDHTHSSYCFGPGISQTPNLREHVRSSYPVLAIVTVRHPLDSFLSVEKLSWLHFEPATLDEYCNRYLRFLEDYEGVPLFKYEDFVAAPVDEMQAMCNALDLPFAEGFEHLFSVHRLSGDSGRTADSIATRERRTMPEWVKRAAAESATYELLSRRLGYLG